MNRRSSAATTLAISLLVLQLAATAKTHAPKQQTTSARAWLERMDKALQTVNYRGIFIYSRANTLKTMQIVHRADKQGGVERIISLNGAAREVIRKHHSVTCILPSRHSVIVEKRRADHPFPGPLTQTDTNVLESSYSFKKVGSGRVAGHQCQIIAVRPKDRYRYGYRLWLDKKTGIPAQSDTLDGHGHLIEKMMFTHLEFPATIPAAELKSSADRKGYTWNIQGEHSIPHDPSTVAKWRVTQLPPGFSLSLNEFQRVAGERSPVRHMVFTDGLASVSVFAEPVDPHQPQLQGVSHMGAVNAFGKVIAGHQITVVGEAPSNTVRMIGESIKKLRK